MLLKGKLRIMSRHNLKVLSKGENQFQCWNLSHLGPLCSLTSISLIPQQCSFQYLQEESQPQPRGCGYANSVVLQLENL